jgi:hypothetical protein
VDYYDSEYRRQYCRERIRQIQDEYRRVQVPKDSQRRRRIAIVQIRSMWDRVRRQVPQRVPVYRP